MLLRFLVLSVVAVAAIPSVAQDPAPKPPLKITPGKVIVPFDRMQRPWGELISLDLATRTGTFRRESNDEVVKFTVMPYAELLHHAANGDLQDFRVGERAIFRLHENEAGQWVWLTYIQDEMNMMNGHKEYFYVDATDAEKGTFTCTQANADRSFTREKGIVIETDKETRYWKGGQPAAFVDIKAGERLRTKTHGAGKGKRRIAWEVFLDDESLAKFQNKQRAVHAERMQKDGSPGYVDETNGSALQVTLFGEGADQNKRLKPGTPIRVAPAGIDRKPSAQPVEGKVVAAKANGRQTEVKIELAAPASGFLPTGLARLWLADK